eukprot:TRINITY_DN3201_c0_g2_i5.p1 TRINITY_DN3201_c0_g2~~TRINITY_DN3201_c0_g2_i5.p1  ORF type:complete len:192 (-),score=19.21 TRINITY_DN3201_c0_g2_i5:104-679(-)
MSYAYSSISTKLKVLPGIEFKRAFEEVKLLPKRCTVSLGDRPVELTLKRTWASLSTWEKIKFIVYIIVASFQGITDEDIEQLMKDSDLVSKMLEEVAVRFPGMSKPLIDERDQYLSYTLSHAPGPVVVGVVGLGHLKGIQKYWNEKVDMVEITSVPHDTGNFTFKVATGSILAAVVLASSCMVYWISSYLL